MKLTALGAVKSHSKSIKNKILRSFSNINLFEIKLRQHFRIRELD